MAVDFLNCFDIENKIMSETETCQTLMQQQSNKTKV